MRINGVRCDVCNKEHLFHDNTLMDTHRDYIPSEWLMLRNCGIDSNKEPMLFCTVKCLLDYAQKASGVSLVPEQSQPTKMRRFLLVDGETADIFQGIRFNDDYVAIRTNFESNPVCWWSSWEKFKAAHDGFGIQWIDQEVSDATK